MAETRYEKVSKISKFIIKKTTPFRISELYKELEENNISTDKEIILDVLGQLYEGGNVDTVLLDDDSTGYRSTYYD